MGFGTLVQRIPFKISGRSTSSSGLYTPSNFQFDYAIGGVPFLSSTNDQRPDVEGPLDQRKQQFDNYKDPGEYSLQQWWLRSQGSFIGGAGVIYQDPDTQGTQKNIRYSKSVGVDPFSNVDFLLLQKEQNNTTSLNNFTGQVGPAYTEAVSSSVFGDICFIAQGSKWDVVSVGTSDMPIASPRSMNGAAGANAYLTGGMEQIADTGQVTSNAFVMLVDPSGAQSGVYKLTRPAGTPAANRLYTVAIGTSLTSTYTQGAYTSYTIGKARGSIYLGVDNQLYVLNPYIAGSNNALPTVSASVPQGQTIVSITDGPDGAYVAANGFNQGYIYKTTVDNLGVVNGLSLTAVLPNGELVGDIAAYLNTFMVVSTTIGIRVGTFTAGFSGSVFSYGPKLLTVARTGNFFGGPEGGSGFGRIAFYGSRAYITTQGLAQHDGSYGLMCVDMSTIVSDDNTGSQFNAYSTWDYVPGTVNPIMDVTVTSAGRCISTTGSTASAKVQLEHRDNYISSGYLETGRCRFNTIEPKLFKFLSVRTATPLQGNLDVTLLDDTGGQTPYITYGPTLDPGITDLSTPTPTGPRNWEAFRFTLHRGQSDSTIGAQLDSWQIKAMPGNVKQRKIIRNFLCFNQEQDKGGNQSGNGTYSLDRLNQVRQMCQRGDTVTLQDLAQNVSTQVVIDDYQFVMMSPPGPNKENYGGYLQVTMRTVADSVPPVVQGVAEGD